MPLSRTEDRLRGRRRRRQPEYVQTQSAARNRRSSRARGLYRESNSDDALSDSNPVSRVLQLTSPVRIMTTIIQPIFDSFTIRLAVVGHLSQWNQSFGTIFDCLGQGLRLLWHTSSEGGTKGILLQQREGHNPALAASPTSDSGHC